MQLNRVLIFALCCACANGDVSHILHNEQPTTHQPAHPYIFSYSAGRAPGETDRQHTEVSDGSGVIRGAFSYIDPKNQVRTVQYVADEHGFHPQLSHQNEDSAAVKLAKQKHFALYNRIAQEHASQSHQHHPTSISGSGNGNEAVARATHKHLSMYERIAAEHAALGAQQEAQRKLLQSQSEHSDVDDGQYHPEKYQ